MLQACERRVEHIPDRHRDAAHRKQHHVVGDGVDPQGLGAEEASDQQVVAVQVDVQEELREQRLHAEGAERPEALS